MNTPIQLSFERFNEPGLYLLFTDGLVLNLTLDCIHQLRQRYLHDPRLLPPSVRAAPEYAPCSVCPKHDSALICHAIPLDVIVFLMSANPDPSHLVAFQVADGPVVASYPYGVQRAMQPFESNGGMLGIRQPDWITAVSEFLDFTRQRPVPFPKLRRGFRYHEAEGQSLSVPSLSARSASSDRKSNFPAAASRSICLSHASPSS